MGLSLGSVPMLLGGESLTVSCLGYLRDSHGPAVDILGAAVHFRLLPKSPDLLSWLSKFLLDPAAQQKLILDLQCLNALTPSRDIGDPVGTNLLDQDFLESPWGQYLADLKAEGFRGRFFHYESHCLPLFRHPVSSNASGGYMQDGWFCYTGPRKSDFCALSPFPAVEIKPDLPEDNRYTEATHVAAFLNCPVLMEASADSPADYLRQDRANYYGVLDGLTALHHAARALSKNALLRLIEILGLDAFKAVDKNGNTFLHALACSKNSGELAARQVNLLKAVKEVFFLLEPDLKKREDFFQYKNKAGDTALNVAANRLNKELVTELVFVPGAKTEGKTEKNPKGMDFAALGLDYGTLLSQRHAASEERAKVSEERVLSLCEERDLDRRAMRAMAIQMESMTLQLEEARERQSLLEDELIRSREERLMLMQTMRTLCLGLGVGHLMPLEDRAEFPMPFRALGDLAVAVPGAGAGAGMGVEEDAERPGGI